MRVVFDTVLPHVNCVGFVVNSTNERLDERTANVFNDVLQLFSKGVGANILPIFTFADGGVPLARQALIADKVLPDPNFFWVKVNNRPFSCTLEDQHVDPKNAGGDGELRIHFDLANHGIKSMFETVLKFPTCSLSDSVEVLKARSNQHKLLMQVHDSIRDSMTEVQQVKSTLAAFVSSIGAPPETLIEVKVPSTNQVHNKLGEFVTNCKNCSTTCHYPCAIGPDSSKIGCAAMKDGVCVKCRCSHAAHYHMEFHWEVTYQTEYHTPQELLDQWKSHTGSLEEALLIALKSLESKRRGLSDKLRMADEEKTKLDRMCLRNDPNKLLRYLEVLQENFKGEGHDMQEFERAKDLCILAAGLARNRDHDSKSQKVIEKIKEILQERVDKLKASENPALLMKRMNDETSHIYATIYEMLPTHVQSKADKPPSANWAQRNLLGATNWKVVTFLENLKLMAKALKLLLETRPPRQSGCGQPHRAAEQGPWRCAHCSFGNGSTADKCGE